MLQNDGSQEAAPKAAADDPSDEQIWNEFAKEKAASAAGTSDGPDPDAINTEAAQEDASAADDATADSTDEDTSSTATTDDQADPHAQVKELEHKLASTKGRERYASKRTQELTEEINRLKKTVESSTNDKSRQAARDKLQRAADEYGDVLGPVTEAFDALSAGQDAFREDVSQRQQMLEQQRQQHIEEQKATFLQAHPDGVNAILNNKPVFDDWLRKQPEADQQVYRENEAAFVDGNAAALLTAKFKAHLHDQQVAATQRADAKKVRLDGARTVPQTPGSSSPKAGGPDPDADPEGYFNYLARKKTTKR